MRILINGLCESAGKTTTTIGLYHNFSEIGDVGLFKPFAANDYWYDYPIVSETIEKNTIYGKDTKLLSELIDLNPKEINPIHRLWAPSSIITGKGLDIRRDKKSLVLDRVWTSDKGMIIVKNSQIEIPNYLEKLISIADEGLEFSNIEELNEYMENLYLQAVEKSYEKIEDQDFFITESYSDIAKPVTINFDAVITVEPGKAYLSDGEKFEKAYSTISKRWKDYSREIKTRKVLEMIETKTFEISPISSDGKTKENYHELFDELREK